MRINYNKSAVLTNSCLNRTNNAMASALEKLSSGYKINHAMDNPAGLAISNRMNSQIRGLSQAKDSTNDGISVVQTVDGALGEITSILQRMNELSIKAGTDSITSSDRKLIDDEIVELKKEITRISTDTEFNGQKLLDGTFELKGYTSDIDVKIANYSEETKEGRYSIDMGQIGIDGTITYDVEGNVTSRNYTVDLDGLNTYLATITEGESYPTITSATYDGQYLTIKGNGNFEISFEYDFEMDITKTETREDTETKDNYKYKETVKTKAGVSKEITYDILGIGAMKIQTGSNEGQELAVIIPEMSLSKMGLSELNLRSVDGAETGIDSIKNALEYVNRSRSRLGAYENRLEHNVSSLDISNENMTASYSRIMDVDMAEEMTEYTSQQVLTQAGISMLAQANEQPEKILQLLQ